MKFWPLALAFSFAVVLLTGCASNKHANTSQRGSSLQSATVNFGIAHRRTSEMVEKAVEPTLEMLDERTVDMHAVAAYWKRYWDTVRAEISALQIALRELDRIAQNTYSTDPGAPQGDLGKAWLDAIAMARTETKRFEELWQKGNQLQASMTGENLEGRAQKSVPVLKDIRNESQDILEALEAFERRARELAGL